MFFFNKTRKTEKKHATSLPRKSRHPHGSCPCTHFRPLRHEPLEDRRMLSITLYVDDDAPGGDGQSWATAYNNLQSALTYASDPINNVTQIWIAEGTYKPTAEVLPGNPRSANFNLLDGVTLYGGFDGTETTLAQRDLSASYTTTLSGDLGVADDTFDNVYNVVYCDSGIEASLDGLTITAGNADGDSADNITRGSGGGIYSSGTLTVTNCTISNNFANAYPKSYGGGIHNNAGTLTITKSIISNNSAGATYLSGYGGGIITLDGILTITDSTISNNSASLMGGGIYNQRSTMTVTNCSFLNNSASSGGGITNSSYYGTTTTTVTNCVFSGNSVIHSGLLPSFRGGAIHNIAVYGTATLTVTNSTISGNSAESSGGGIANGSICFLHNNIVADNDAPDDPDLDGSFQSTSSHNLIGDGTGQSDLIDGVDDNLVGTAASPIDPGFVDPTNGNYRLDTGSPAIDAGDNVLIPSGIIADLDGNYRIANSTVDMGAYEYGSVALLAGDANGDKIVNSSDFAVITNNWQVGVPGGYPGTATWAMGDFNGDGKVDSSDFAVFSNNWQATVTLSPLTILKTLAQDAEPEEVVTRYKYTPPSNALLAVATVPRQETLPPRRFARAATDAVLAGSLEKAEDFTAIARDIAAASAKEVHNPGHGLGMPELDLYDDFE